SAAPVLPLYGPGRSAVAPMHFPKLARVLLTVTLFACTACSTPQRPAAGPADLSPAEFGIRVVIDSDLREEIAYPLGTSPNRYVPTNKFQVEVVRDGTAVAIDCTSLGKFSRSIARITLDPTSHTARADVSWETDVVKKTHWSNVYGLIV